MENGGPGLCRAGCRVFPTVLDGDGPRFGLLFVANRAVGVTQPDIEQTQVVPLKIGGHRCPLERRRAAWCDMFADAAYGQGWNGRHGDTSSNGAHSRGLFAAVQLGASLGVNDTSPVTECYVRKEAGPRSSITINGSRG